MTGGQLITNVTRFSQKMETKAVSKAFGARPAGDGLRFPPRMQETATVAMAATAGERSVEFSTLTTGNRLEQTLNSQAISTGKAIKTHVLSAAEQLLAHKATRFYVQWFVTLTIIQFGIAAIGLNLFATASFRYACFFGMAFPAATSFVSFLLTEWAFDQPNLIFMAVAMGSMVVRMFNLLLVFAVGLLIIKFSMFGLLVGLLGSFLTYMVIEIMYIHNKGSLLGH